jgi:hypothetical protein
MSRLALIVAFLAVVAVASATQCHPQCKWQCDDPSCPAVCHPVCGRPKCEMKCEEVQCAKCVIHCERPTCSIRCPKDFCEKQDCPQCETVCAPAQCHTTCTAPEPKCSPVCEELECNNKCAKPTNCARPKCELQCERPACEEPDFTNGGCCGCNTFNTQYAITNAIGGCGLNCPSFLEVFHSIKHKEQESGTAQCCPCNKNSAAAPDAKH